MARLRDEEKYVARGGMTRAEVVDAVRERDGQACVRCGLTAAEHIERHGRTLQVHRKEPGSLYTLDGCETLCCDCHAPEPKRGRGEPDAEKTRVTIGVRLSVSPQTHAALRVLAARCRMSMARYCETLVEQAVATGHTVVDSPIDDIPSSATAGA